MMKKLTILFVLIFVGNLSALPTHVLNTAFILMQEKPLNQQDQIKVLLSSFFSENTGEVAFLIEEFINWVTDQPSKMTNCLNEAAFHTASENRALAMNAIKNYFGSEKPEVIEFATAFVDWGTELLKINAIFNPERKK